MDWEGAFKIDAVPKKLALIRHAGAVFPDMSAYESRLVMHFSGEYAEGYKWPAAAASEFHEALANFDFLIDESWPYQGTQASIAAKYNVSSPDMIPAFAAGRVYTLDKSMSHNAEASDYFESAIAHPDDLLSDLVAILHADPSSAAESASDATFARHAATGSVVLMTQDMCVETRALSSSCADTAGLLGMIASVGIVVDTCPTVLALAYAQCPAVMEPEDLEEPAAFPVGAIAGIAVGGLLIAVAVVATGAYIAKKNKAPPAKMDALSSVA